MSKKWNAEIQFPSDSCFQNRILGIKFAPNNNGNPMLTVECEVVAPTVYEVGGEEIEITGVKTKSYLTSTILDNGVVDEDATKKARKKITEDFLKPLGIDGESVNWNNPDLESKLRGKVVLTQMACETQEQRKTPNKVEIEKAKKEGRKPEGEIQKHPVTGRALVQYWPKITKFFALAKTGHVAAPY